MLLIVAPSADAIVTFNIAGPLQLLGDYTISPASVTLNELEFNRTVTVRVFDDAAFEGTESFTVGYTLNNNGGTALVGDVNQTCVVTINDNDALPELAVLEINYAGTYNAEIGLSSGPFNGSTQSNKRSKIYGRF
ncbi:MAG: hypothetical protein IPP02_13150 [Chitinophagaceae bacterium]|nr:hypothetical protein [Chitinophagaceae bacterium]